jgi:hypothetical protein
MQAKKQLSQDGSVVLALGLRFPYEILRLLFESVNYEFEELYWGFKKQAQIKPSLLSYSNIEKLTGTNYIFFESDNIENDITNNYSCESLLEKKIIKQTSATEALALYGKSNKCYSHIVLITRAWPRR